MKNEKKTFENCWACNFFAIWLYTTNFTKIVLENIIQYVLKILKGPFFWDTLYFSCENMMKVIVPSWQSFKKCFLTSTKLVLYNIAIICYVIYTNLKQLNIIISFQKSLLMDKDVSRIIRERGKKEGKRKREQNMR